jgi:hypothetical protein
MREVYAAFWGRRTDLVEGSALENPRQDWHKAYGVSSGGGGSTRPS